MSKAQAPAKPVTDDLHVYHQDALIRNGAVLIQHANREASEIWFEYGGRIYHAALEECAGPLPDLSGKDKTVHAE